MRPSARFSHLFVLVSDLERARAFYVDVLGLELVMQHEGYVRVGGADGFHIGFEEGPPGAVGAPGIEIVIQVDDVDARFREIKAAGVPFDEVPEDQDWGARHAWLRDPDGYRLSIYSSVREG